MIGLTGLYDGLGPVGVVEAVGVELGFQGYTGAFAVVNAVFALFVQIVAGVNLNTGAVRVDFHGSSRNRVRQNGAGIAVNFPVVVEAALQMQRLVVRFDVATDGLGPAEVHGGICDAALLAELCAKNGLDTVICPVSAMIVIIPMVTLL